MMPAPKILKRFIITWGFRIGIGAFAVVGVLCYLSLDTTIATNKAVFRTNDVLNQLSQIQVLMESAESSQRGFVVSDKPIFHQNFEDLMGRVPNEINKLLDLTSENPTQVSNTLELRRIIDRRFDKMKTMVRMHLEHAPQEAVAQATDVEVTAEVRTRIAKMETIEKNTLSQRLANSERKAQHTKLLLIFGGILSALLLYANRMFQQRRADEEFQRANLLNMIMKSMGDSLVVVDEGNRITHFNLAAERLLGSPKPTAAPEQRIHVHGLFDPKTNTPMKAEQLPLTRALKGETSDDVEVLIKNANHPNGVITSVNTRPLLAKGGQIVGAVSLFRDYTRRKQKEQSLESEKERALQASHLKSEALASMSHEIRTPMNGVLGMVTLLLDTRLEEAQKSYALTIKSSAEALLNLINGILDHAKIEAGKLTLDNFDFNLSALANDVVEMFRYQARSKRLELLKDVTPEASEWFHGDANRIRQILVNLVGNAFKFTEQGSISIKVTAVRKSDLERELRFEVRDTGIGISQENQKKLFQKFSQVHSNKGRYGGTGLGLLLCKQFVQLMGGEIGIESTEGQGSVFWFTVKVAPGMRQQKPRDHHTFVANLSGHVLVAEDQPVNRQVVKSYLEKLGVTCDIHHNGKEALDAFMAGPDRYDLVLMDVQMPVMDGFTCCREIRKFEGSRALPQLPIIALTAEGRSQDRDDCIAAGMDDFLSKPIDMEQFTDTLKKWLRPKMRKTETDENLVSWTALTKLSELKADGRPLDVALVEEFLSTSATMIENLEEALRNQDSQHMQELAHAIKSPARTIGLMPLGDLCEAIEDGQVDANTSRRLSDLHHRSVLELRAYLRRRSSEAA